MPRDLDRQESFRIAAEKMRLKKEKEAREDKEFYEKITSGMPWLLFKAVVIFCTLMVLVTTIDTFIDGPTKKLSKESVQIDRDWEYSWHKVLNVEGFMFTPHLRDWSDHLESSFTLTYSPIFRTGKTLTYTIKSEFETRKHEEIRQRSFLTWFPAFQIFLLIPLFTFMFKRQSAWFNFARIASFAVIFPGTLLVIYFTIF